MPKPLYIFDVDGTLALIEHRRHFVENGSRKWDEFYKACHADEPNWPVLRVLKELHLNNDVLFFSGRSDLVREDTVRWLERYTAIPPDLIDRDLTMRRHGDYTPDDVLKKGWLHNMLDVDRQRLVAVFEDRDRMVKMWRGEGIVCFQVAEGEF